MTTRTITVHVDEQTARLLEQRALRLGLELDDAAAMALTGALNSPPPVEQSSWAGALANLLRVAGSVALAPSQAPSDLPRVVRWVHEAREEHDADVTEAERKRACDA